MRAAEVFAALEAVAPLRYQEGFDNAGLQVGDARAAVTGALLCTDVTEPVLAEAIDRGYNLVVSHHPLIFHGLKKVAGRSAVERMVATALKHDIVVYSAHTNIDNTPVAGVSFKMAEKLGLTDAAVLDEHDGQPFGSGVIASCRPTTARELLLHAKQAFGVAAVRYGGDADKPVRRVALCGGAGAFLIGKAIAAGADIFVTSDVKYHELFEHQDAIVVADIGHYESEQFTKEIFRDIITRECAGVPVAFAATEQNPIHYI